MTKLTVRGFLRVGDDIVPLEQIPEDELAKAKADMLENFRKGMSEYYSHHIDEFMKLGDNSQSEKRVPG